MLSTTPFANLVAPFCALANLVALFCAAANLLTLFPVLVMAHLPISFTTAGNQIISGVYGRELRQPGLQPSLQVCFTIERHMRRGTDVGWSTVHSAKVSKIFDAKTAECGGFSF